jgi:hypothetical protein
MKYYEIIMPRRVAFTEHEVYYVEAKNETEAFAKVSEGMYEPEYEDAGDYETIEIYEPEVKEIPRQEVSPSHA